MPNYKSISQKTAEKNLENLILAKGNNSGKSKPSVRKLELDLYYVMTNSYTIFQVNISKDCTPVLPKSRHTLKMMVSGLFVEFEITINHIYDIILNTVTMRT